MSARAATALFLGCALICACGGGGGGTSGGAPSAVSPVVTPTVSPTAPATTVSAAISAGSIQQSVSFPTLGTGYVASLTLPATSSGTATVTATLSLSPPPNGPVLQSRRRLPANIGGTLSGILYGTLAASSSIILKTTPSFSFTLPSNVSLPTGALAYIGAYDPTNPSAGWQLFLGPAAANGQTFVFPSTSVATPLVGGVKYLFAFFSSAQPLTVPTQAPVSDAAYSCPTNDSESAAATGPSGASGLRGRIALRDSQSSASGNGSLLAISYERSSAMSSRLLISSNESHLGLTVLRSLDFSHIDRVVHVVSIDPSKTSSIISSLRTDAGVIDVSLAGKLQYLHRVTTPFFPNDPFFDGFQSSGSYLVGPYEESSSAPGQWDMHAIGLEYAFGYSQPNNGSGIVDPNALGSSTIKIAVIDSGEDTNQADLSSKIVYQRCFITNPSNVQSTSAFTTDPDGHGTDVAGIAAAEIGNGVGFAGAGGNAVVFGYRVFPTPDSTCESLDKDDQCGVTDVDVASAIQDAVSQGVNVINLSLGGGGCTNGIGSDELEQNAIEDALAADVIVIASSGNGGSNSVSQPACINGVIAVGASALADGLLNGAGNTLGSTSNPIEYVASYSNYGSPASALGSAAAWGIVAPGGDGNSSSDPDYLHWIINLWTSTPYSAADAAIACSSSGIVECLYIIDGTSMASPHVAGAAALILSVNSRYQSPAAMKQLLCATADDIGDPKEGCGRLNVYRAMAIALGDPNPPGATQSPSPAPSATSTVSPTPGLTPSPTSSPSIAPVTVEPDNALRNLQQKLGAKQ